jgi:hypothetical protein
MAAAFADFASVTDAFMALSVDPSGWGAAGRRATTSFGAILLPTRGPQTPLISTTHSLGVTQTMAHALVVSRGSGT